MEETPFNVHKRFQTKKRGRCRPAHQFVPLYIMGLLPVLQVKGNIDFEQNSAFEIRAEASDRGQPPMASQCKVLVEVIDVNDNAPEITVTTLLSTVSENAKSGTAIALVSVLDRDHVKGNIDFEQNSAFEIRAEASDRGQPPMASQCKVLVEVIDVNDNAPEITVTTLLSTVSEDAKAGTAIALVSVLDRDHDEGTNSEILYSISKGDQDKILVIFDLDATSGAITVKGSAITVKSNIDFEQQNAFEIRAQASDKGHPPMTAHCKVLVEVMDLNDNAPEITVTSLLKTVKEDVQIGTAVALVSVSDADGGKNGIVTCSVRNKVPFKLELNYRNYYSLVVDGPLDRENMSQYNVTISATDEGAPSLSSSNIITVDIADVNDNPPRFAEPVLNVYIKENSPVGTLMTTVSASDADINENGHVTYSILDINSNSGVPLSTLVNINSVTGDLSNLQSFNYEEMKTFQFGVQAADAGVPPLSSNATVNVFVLDENDNSPVVLPPYAEHGSVNTENVPYTAEAGYFIAKIRAVDADSGYNALLSYHISEPKGNNLFRIGTSNGEIRTKRRMSDSDLKTHPLIIAVSDNGEPALSVTVSIDVVVVERTDDIQTQFRHKPVKDDTFSSLNLYLLIAIISVSVIFLLSLISLIAVKCHRTDSNFSGYNPPMITTHPDGTWSYSKSMQQYDVCFSSDTLKSDVVVFPTHFPPADAELISINGGDTFQRTQTLPNKEKVRAAIK
ncbi:hypothetical protein ACEWY4_026829 [Coilia grayii]|uniref:Cadherin domain-containing protein n=1 Tax=Coilia grayii TaxID=363190 RepID=A0ABD1ITM2_9TELE